MQTATDIETQAYRARPEPGQLVEVRRRQWVVAEVNSSTLESNSASQNCVTLSSIDEDGLGEELEVIWELEPGAQVIERAGLPSITGQDDSNTLDAFLDAVRWGAATNADRGFLQAPFRSGVSIEDFQLDPLVRAIDMARVNLLIADNVGLGKTIEAGLVIQELLLRHRARTVLIICPASLQEKWRVEMLEKFGLDFRLVDTEGASTFVKFHWRPKRGVHSTLWDEAVKRAGADPDSQRRALFESTELGCVTCHNGVYKPLYGLQMAKHYPALWGGHTDWSPPLAAPYTKPVAVDAAAMPVLDSTGAVVTDTVSKQPPQ